MKGMVLVALKGVENDAVVKEWAQKSGEVRGEVAEV
jgi:hypothetical protein